MEPEGSLPHSQVPATCPYPQPHQSTPCLTPHFLEIHLNILLPSTHGSSKWFISFRFPHQIPVYTYTLAIRATHPAHLIVLHLMTRTIWGDEYTSLSFSLCTFLHSYFRNILKSLSKAQLQLPIYKEQHPILQFVHSTAVSVPHVPLSS